MDEKTSMKDQRKRKGDVPLNQHQKACDDSIVIVRGATETSLYKLEQLLSLPHTRRISRKKQEPGVDRKTKKVK
jgi:hypothetical protein